MIKNTVCVVMILAFIASDTPISSQDSLAETGKQQSDLALLRTSIDRYDATGNGDALAISLMNINEALRQPAIDFLSQLNSAPEQLLQIALFDNDVSRRIDAVRALALFRCDLAAKACELALQDPDANVVAFAIGGFRANAAHTVRAEISLCTLLPSSQTYIFPTSLHTGVDRPIAYDAAITIGIVGFNKGETAENLLRGIVFEKKILSNQLLEAQRQQIAFACAVSLINNMHSSDVEDWYIERLLDKKTLSKESGIYDLLLLNNREHTKKFFDRAKSVLDKLVVAPEDDVVRIAATAVQSEEE